jgi:CheY-like chemotaxis protein
MIDPRTVNVLYVDDDDICQMMMRRTFKLAKFANPITCAQDGIDALERLQGTNGRERFPRPFLILTDLNMARMGGIELLQELRHDDELKESIVFILSTSNAAEIKAKAYNLGVAGYIHKTNSPNALMETAALLDTYCRVVEFPAA